MMYCHFGKILYNLNIEYNINDSKFDILTLGVIVVLTIIDK